MENAITQEIFLFFARTDAGSSSKTIPSPALADNASAYKKLPK